MSNKRFSVPSVRSFYNEVEQPILKFWEDNSIFNKSIEQRPEDDHFVFYDGPPFVTGLPHYGHLLGSIIKDIIPRYQTMKGKRVERLWGWDCHGIPIEEMVERKYKTKNRREIEENLGIEKFTDACASYVNDVSGEWKWYVDRIARWVDMDKPYRTMDIDYMESVMWVFKQFYEKDLIYKGKRVSLYCTRCGTPLSNFEIAMDNSYKDVEDPSVYVKFPLNYHKTGVGAGVVIENDNNEILMIKRIGEGRDHVWGIVGGKYEEVDNKDLGKTVKREIKEEIGCDTEKLEYMGYSMDIFEGRLFKTHHFKAKIVGEPKVVDPEGDLAPEIHWVAKKDIPWDKMHIPTRNCLKNIIEGNYKKLGYDLSKEPNIEKPKVSVIAWTTTPWTLPANSALVVDVEAIYVTCKVADEFLIMAKERAEDVLTNQEYTIVDEYPGKELVGNSYQSLFNYFEPTKADHKIYAADFVNLSDGSGIIHMAPGFGEDDTTLGKEIGLTMFESINDEGTFIDQVADYKGIYFKKADPQIIENLTERGLMLKSERITHSYPMCYRCSTPLVYKAQDSWYVDIQKIKPQLHKNSEAINWIPEHIKEGRFSHTIETSPDWGLTRTRYWATPIPIWKCDDCDTLEVHGSRAEIEEKSGQKVDNLHRPHIDKHTYPCEKCKKGTMKRVEEVVDVWLESASMPYAQFHYPFENKEKFEKNFPGDFIIEYVGQVRAWFNVMHRVSTILFDSHAFNNVIATGTIKGTDGRKMSKSFKNYPDPKVTLEKYGGDAFRYYMAGSVLTTGEDLNVSEEGIGAPVKEVLLPFMNIYKYFALYANQHGYDPSKCNNCPHKSQCEENMNVLDRWILTRVKSASIMMDESLSTYKIAKAVDEIKPLIDDVSTWFIRRSRDRFVAGDDFAINTLFKVIKQMTIIFAPIIPFTSEFVYQELKKGVGESMELESVHLELYPEGHEITKEDTVILSTMDRIRDLVSLGQNIRVEKELPLKQPLAKAYYISKDKISKNYLDLVAAELNVENVEQVEKAPKKKELVVREGIGYSIAIDTEITEELTKKRLFREISRAIQSARRKANLQMGETAKVTLFAENNQILEVIRESNSDLLESASLSELTVAKEEFSGDKVVEAKIGTTKEILLAKVV